MYICIYLYTEFPQFWQAQSLASEEACWPCPLLGESWSLPEQPIEDTFQNPREFRNQRFFGVVILDTFWRVTRGCYCCLFFRCCACSRSSSPAVSPLSVVAVLVVSCCSG